MGKGEHVYNLSREYKNDHNEIQWAMIAGLRHRLVHDYGGTNWNIIADVVFEELPVLIEQLEKFFAKCYVYRFYWDTH